MSLAGLSGCASGVGGASGEGLIWSGRCWRSRKSGLRIMKRREHHPAGLEVGWGLP